MKKYLIYLALGALPYWASGQAENAITHQITNEVTSDKAKDSLKLHPELSVFLNYNFLDKASFQNATPEVFYGWDHTEVINNNLRWYVMMGPTVSSQVGVTDSSAFFPALMLPGSVNIFFNQQFILETKNKFQFIINPVSAGLKFISEFEGKEKSILQHYVKTGAAVRYSNRFAVIFHYTWAWHDLVSATSNNFNESIGPFSSRKNIQYVSVNLRTQLNNIEGQNNKPMYLYLSWKQMLNADELGGFPNEKILTVGINKVINTSL